MKNLNFIIALTTSLLFYIVLFTYTYFDLNNQFKEIFRSPESLKIHQKYSKTIHHIRQEIHLDKYFKKTNYEDLIFTHLNDKDKKIKVLLQGDSWFEQINGKGGKENYFSFKLFQDFGKKYDISFINGGTSSYSPSLMNVQIDVLEKDFNIKPDIIIAFIDQINIGDEICRYKKNKVYKNGKLIKVSPESEFKGVGWYNYSEVYALSNIHYKHKNKAIKTFKLINFKFYSRLNYIKKKINIKLQNILNKKIVKNKKCYWAEIEKHLTSTNKDDTEYFKEVLREYIEKTKEKTHINKLILVTFPYKDHFYPEEKKTYNLNMSDLVSEVSEEYYAVEHLNFSKILINNNDFDFENAWTNDHIHLNAYNHGNIFTQNILNELKAQID